MTRAPGFVLAVVVATGCATQPLDFDPPFGHPLDASTKKPVDLGAPTAPPDFSGVAIDFAVGPAGAQTGAPCKQNSDCAGTKAFCLQKDSTGALWPGGDCSSFCNPQKSDPNTGINPGCPGPAVCDGAGTTGSCLTFCDGSFGMTPCSRAGYLCFFGCEPGSLSECDPSMLGSCPQDGGVTLFSDGGTAYSGRACVRNGYDEVGLCADGCDPFAQNCPPQQGQPAACYASYDDGEAACLAIYQGVGEGQPCSYITQCNPGLECFYSVNAAVCTPYCGGPNQVPCPNNRICIPLDGAVPTSRVGVCKP